MNRGRKTKTHFVPKEVFRTTFAGVVPLCIAASACGSGASGGQGDSGMFNGAVGCAGFSCMGGVGVQAFADGGDAMQFSVALIGFDGAGPPDAAADGSNTDASERDAPVMTVACIGFCGGADAAFRDGGDSG
jgi:hypothetical protein